MARLFNKVWTAPAVINGGAGEDRARFCHVAGAQGHLKSARADR
jgi:hypothetical protein